MIGAIAGDIIGSPYEFRGVDPGFPLFSPVSRFTDDTVMTIACADAILHDKDYASAYRYWGNKYPNRGYGGRFSVWLGSKNPQPYNSLGNGAGMRCSATAYAHNSLEQVLLEARRSAEVTHNHPSGISGAQATASAIFLARMGKGNEEIKQYIADTFGYDLNRSIERLRKQAHFDETCDGTVPQAIIAFLETSDYESVIRIAAGLNYDVDTICCVAGAIAAARYGVPDDIVKETKKRLTPDLLEVVEQFESKYL